MERRESTGLSLFSIISCHEVRLPLDYSNNVICHLLNPPRKRAWLPGIKPYTGSTIIIGELGTRRGSSQKLTRN